MKRVTGKYEGSVIPLLLGALVFVVFYTVAQFAFDGDSFGRKSGTVGTETTYRPGVASSLFTPCEPVID